MRVALFAAGLALAVVILILVVKKDDAKPTKAVVPASEGSARETAPTPTPERSPTPEHVSASSGSASAEATVARPETAVADAFAALTAGDAKTALAIAEQVLAREPDHKGMKKVAAMAACALGKADVAQSYYDAVDRSARSSITSVCHQHGIRLQVSAKRPGLQPGRLRNDD